MAPESMSIMSIPREVLQSILALCDASSIASFSMTASSFHHLVYHSEDNFLWRELIIRGWGDPRAIHPKPVLSSRRASFALTSDDADWKFLLQSRIRAEKIANSKEPCADDVRFAAETFIDIIATSEPYSEDAETLSPGLGRLSAILRSSSILHHLYPGDPALDQLLARLKVYFILSDGDGDGDEDENEDGVPSEAQRNRSRCFIYNLSRYSFHSRWGPYLADGGEMRSSVANPEVLPIRTRGDAHVNWEHLHHLMTVVWSNLAELPLRWSEVRPRVGLEAVRARSAPANFTAEDWAGIEGCWRRYVCFMDYRDLFAFNFSNTFRGPRHIAYFQENPRFREATRLIQVNLKVVTRAELEHCPDADFPNPFPDYPPIFFNGSSRGVNGNESLIEGIVRMAEDGTVRYRFWEKVSIYDSATQWSSEGVQVGNVGCAAGVVGVWTTTMHDEGDPVGPFWLWKVNEDYPEEVVDHI